MIPTQEDFDVWMAALPACQFPGAGPCGDFIESPARASSAGCQAATAGFGADVNPHPPGTDPYWFWYRGWRMVSDG